MKQAIVYSFKVWLTSVIAAPIIFFLINFISTGISSNIFQLVNFLFYLYIVLATAVASVITWLIFYAIIYFVSRSGWPNRIGLLAIFSSSELLVVVTFKLFLVLLNGFDNTTFNTLMLCHCICIGGGILYYKFEPENSEPN
ncbi:hypothetical protein [Mucilaginibacter pocheonensis]|uniref:ABC-type transport system involved in multi-copper enzyme maturation permease subunit n=1 Tax=Mucilaginibacter pocheonensis TaxID=398050 RepID=A0ABU1TJM1_9SPHI|nr:hypothetical protein [Mucilaginibacter pocheonensis]MDR6945060.1 ABC-type transport system involved in multi-copper enzyme maturation permease subunit [Mucilaginibacter pocheonensis]